MKYNPTKAQIIHKFIICCFCWERARKNFAFQQQHHQHKKTLHDGNRNNLGASNWQG